jgi:2-hydroxy-3-oxopropionate reductase
MRLVKKTLGMIGLGKMGLALSQQMIIDGHTVYGYDIDPERMEMLLKEGGTPLENAQEVGEKSDITFSILLKASHIEENLFGINGIDKSLKSGHIHVEMSTMPPSFSKEISEKLEIAGIDMLDAPISGSHPAVNARTITFMVGGKEKAFVQVQPILESLSADATHTGPAGSGSVMKVVTNLFVNSSTALICEMILTGERAGLSHDVMMHCLSKGSVRGAMLNQLAPRLFERNFKPQGAVEIFVKDMGLAIDLAKEHGIDLQVVPAARKMFQRAEAAGWGKDDASRVLEVYEGKD